MVNGERWEESGLIVGSRTRGQNRGGVESIGQPERAKPPGKPSVKTPNPAERRARVRHQPQRPNRVPFPKKRD